MKCPNCQGTRTDPKTGEPCFECLGGEIHCCDGEQAQPEDPTTHDEFDCIDCGRPVFAFPAGSPIWSDRRCATCMVLPGWYLIPELRRIWEPDDTWQPPPHPPKDYVCEVPGCGRRDLLLRLNDYHEAFRGRCPDHVDALVFRALHHRRNRGFSHDDR